MTKTSTKKKLTTVGTKPAEEQKVPNNQSSNDRSMDQKDTELPILGAKGEVPMQKNPMKGAPSTSTISTSDSSATTSLDSTKVKQKSTSSRSMANKKPIDKVDPPKDQNLDKNEVGTAHSSNEKVPPAPSPFISPDETQFMVCYNDENTPYLVTLRSLFYNGIEYPKGKQIPVGTARNFVRDLQILYENTRRRDNDLSGVVDKLSHNSDKLTENERGKKSSKDEFKDLPDLVDDSSDEEDEVPVKKQNRKVPDRKASQSVVRDLSYHTSMTVERRAEQSNDKEAYFRILKKYFKHTNENGMMQLRKGKRMFFIGKPYKNEELIPVDHAETWAEIKVKEDAVKRRDTGQNNQSDQNNNVYVPPPLRTPANLQSTARKIRPLQEEPLNNQTFAQPPKEKQQMDPAMLNISDRLRKAAKENERAKGLRDDNNSEKANENPPDDKGNPKDSQSSQTNNPRSGNGGDGDGGNDDDDGGDDDDDDDDKTRDTLASAKSDKEATRGDPQNPGQPMPSPIVVYGSRFCYRKKTIEDLKTGRNSHVRVNVNIFEFDRTARNENDPTLNNTVYQRAKEEFKKQYDFSSIHFRAYRIIFNDLVALWSKGATKANPDVFLYRHMGSRMRKDFKLQLTEHLAQANIPRNSYRKDISYLTMQKIPSDTELDSTTADVLLPLLFVCLMPTGTLGSKDSSFESRVIELIKDEISYLLESIQPYLANIEVYLSNYETVTREWFLALDEIDKTLQIMEWYVNEWYPVKPKTKELSGYLNILNSVLNSAPTGLNMYGLFTMWTVYSHKKYYHSSHLIRDKRQVMMVERKAILPSQAFVQRHLDPPLAKRENLADVTRISIAINRLDDKSNVKRNTFVPYKRKKTVSYNHINVAGSDEEVDEQDEQEQYQDEYEQNLAMITSSGGGQPNRQHSSDNRLPRANNGNPSYGNKPYPSRDNQNKNDNIKPRKGACDAYLLRGHCYNNECPHSHDEQVVKLAKQNYISKWNSNKTYLACLANMELLKETFENRTSVVNDYEHFEASVDKYKAEHPDEYAQEDIARESST